MFEGRKVGRVFGTGNVTKKVDEAEAIRREKEEEESL
jgi:hypothetical protein